MCESDEYTFHFSSSIYDKPTMQYKCQRLATMPDVVPPKQCYSYCFQPHDSISPSFASVAASAVLVSWYPDPGNCPEHVVERTSQSSPEKADNQQNKHKIIWVNTKEMHW